MLAAPTCTRVHPCEVPSLPCTCTHVCHSMHSRSEMLTAPLYTRVCMCVRFRQAPHCHACAHACPTLQDLTEILVAPMSTHMYTRVRCQQDSHCHVCAHTCVNTLCGLSEVLRAPTYAHVCGLRCSQHPRAHVCVRVRYQQDPRCHACAHACHTIRGLGETLTAHACAHVNFSTGVHTHVSLRTRQRPPVSCRAESTPQPSLSMGTLGQWVLWGESQWVLWGAGQWGPGGCCGVPSRVPVAHPGRALVLHGGRPAVPRCPPG